MARGSRLVARLAASPPMCRVAIYVVARARASCELDGSRLVSRLAVCASGRARESRMAIAWCAPNEEHRRRLELPTLLEKALRHADGH